MSSTSNRRVIMSEEIKAARAHGAKLDDGTKARH